MDDKELLISQERCLACIAGLTSLTGEANSNEGFHACECPKKKVDLSEIAKKLLNE